MAEGEPRRVDLTDVAARLLLKLTVQHGPLMFHQSGGCFPPAAEFAVAAKVRDGAAYEQAAADPTAWWATQARRVTLNAYISPLRHPPAHRPGLPQPPPASKTTTTRHQECSLTEVSALSVKAGKPHSP
jgi:hypothetical protein